MLKITSGGKTTNKTGSATLTATDGTNNVTVTVEETGTIATPTASKDITANGNNIDVTNYKYVNVNVPTSSGGITPSGKKTITDTSVQDVTNYAQAQVVDSNLVAGNIKKGVSILGVAGSYEAPASGGGDFVAPSFAKIIDIADDTTTIDWSDWWGISNIYIRGLRIDGAIVDDNPFAERAAYTFSQNKSNASGRNLTIYSMGTDGNPKSGTGDYAGTCSEDGILTLRANYGQKAMRGKWLVWYS